MEVHIFHYIFVTFRGTGVKMGLQFFHDNSGTFREAAFAEGKLIKEGVSSNSAS